MDEQLRADWDKQAMLLDKAAAAAKRFLAGLAERRAAVFPRPQPALQLPDHGLGAEAALALFQERFGAMLSASAGPRYFGFVTGGATPAALMGDWLASTADQNVTADRDSGAAHLERETIGMLRELFGLPPEFAGSFVSGATISNFVGLAQARQWLGKQQGIDVAAEGLYGLQAPRVLAATPHASSYKALAMLGLGRARLTRLPAQPGREALAVPALAQFLEAHPREPLIVIASSGTVNTADFDDLLAISALKERFNFWLHVDAAFGGFAACVPDKAGLLAGLASADSITIDAHKWLNVPYDSAMQFSRHPALQWAVFQNAAAYLGFDEADPSLVHWTPQNSRRWRALPAWMTLMAYGRAGYGEIVARNCDLARWLGEQVDGSAHFERLAPVHLNVVCFTLRERPPLAAVQQFLDRLQADGRVFLTPTIYQDVPAIRAAVANWQTTQADMATCWAALRDVAGA